MTDRYFENFMRDFIAETSTVKGDNNKSEGLEKESQDSLINLLSMPYPNLSAKFKVAALDLKETIAAKTWPFIQDLTVYAGGLGTAFLLLKSFQLTGDMNDLNLASEIIKTCDRASTHSRDITFLCGRGGVCALGAVVASYLQDTQMLQYYLTQFKGVFGDKEFVDAAIEAGEVVWKHGLLKRVGICHGISGNAYVFLALYRLTGDVEMLYRAKAFACFLVDRGMKLISQGKMHGGDNKYSLFEGLGGMAYLLMDMIDPTNARFPAYEL